MLLSLAPRENQKESHDKVSEKDLIDEAKFVTIGNKKRPTKGNANLLISFDNFPSVSVSEFLKDLSTKSDFAFFDKNGNRLCLQDKADLDAVKQVLNYHKRKRTIKKKTIGKKKTIVATRYLYFHDMKPKKKDEPLGPKEKHKLSRQQPTKYKNRANSPQSYVL
jgi:hypothetical protein